MWLSSLHMHIIIKSFLPSRSKPECLPISSLFTHLLSSPPSAHYPDIFLLTYRIFTNAHEVLDALIEAHRKELHSRTKNKQVKELLE